MIPSDDTESLVLRPRRQWAVLGPVIVTLIFYAACVIMLVGPRTGPVGADHGGRERDRLAEDLDDRAPAVAGVHEHRECVWSAGGGTVLSVSLALERRWRGPDGGASEHARESFASRVAGCSARVAGVGDEACVVGRGGGAVRIVARKANVLVTVSLDAGLPDERAVREARGLAAAAIGAIVFE
ncbi:hypothetical protein AB0L25_01795 [Spirillospora sp. NPDC052242]